MKAAGLYVLNNYEANPAEAAAGSRPVLRKVKKVAAAATATVEEEHYVL